MLPACCPYLPACTAPGTALDTRFWKYYLAPTSFQAVTRVTRSTWTILNMFGDLLGLGPARFAEILQYFSECQILLSFYSIVFNALTLKLLIQTSLSVSPELPVSLSLAENCQKFSKMSTSLGLGCAYFQLHTVNLCTDSFWSYLARAILNSASTVYVMVVVFVSSRGAQEIKDSPFQWELFIAFMTFPLSDFKQ